MYNTFILNRNELGRTNNDVSFSRFKKFLLYSLTFLT